MKRIRKPQQSALPISNWRANVAIFVSALALLASVWSTYISYNNQKITLQQLEKDKQKEFAVLQKTVISTHGEIKQCLIAIDETYFYAECIVRNLPDFNKKSEFQKTIEVTRNGRKRLQADFEYSNLENVINNAKKLDLNTAIDYLHKIEINYEVVKCNAKYQKQLADVILEEDTLLKQMLEDYLKNHNVEELNSFIPSVSGAASH